MEFEKILKNEEIRTYIDEADNSLKALGYTEHSYKHVMKCVNTSEMILRNLKYDEETIDAVKIASYMHDIGNVINRVDHAQSGAIMAFRILDKLGLEKKKIARIIAAIGNHDEETAFPINEIAAALIIADKTDVRRSRVRNHINVKEFEIHDRVNYAVTKNEINMDDEKIILNLTIDTTITKVFEYFEIFLSRMLLCKKAANYFNLDFKLIINNQELM